LTRQHSVGIVPTGMIFRVLPIWRGFSMNSSVEDITAVIPHRPPFLLIDSIREVEFGKRGTGIRTIRPGDDFVSDYLPGSGKMPRTMLIEALAQTAAFVVAGKKIAPETTEEEKKTYPTIGLLVRVGKFIFSGDAVRGDTVYLDVELSSSFGSIYKFLGSARIGTQEICRGNLTFSVY
jgi:3-hydroxyacyl-[acyl-carrier-protein] dehydratase